MTHLASAPVIGSCNLGVTPAGTLIERFRQGSRHDSVAKATSVFDAIEYVTNLIRPGA